jgi:PIN domain nuclease of toxin-antitoxin system
MTGLPAYLLDTHVLYWHLFQPGKLSKAARQAIRDGEAGGAALIVYHLVLAELFYALQKHSRESEFPNAVRLLGTNVNYRIEPIVLEDIEQLSAFPELSEMHDRMIVAATNRFAATLLTKDRKVRASPQVKCLW